MDLEPPYVDIEKSQRKIQGNRSMIVPLLVQVGRTVANLL
jgi:hypothetical protein